MLPQARLRRQYASTVLVQQTNNCKWPTIIIIIINDHHQEATERSKEWHGFCLRLLSVIGFPKPKYPELYKSFSFSQVTLPKVSNRPSGFCWRFLGFLGRQSLDHHHLIFKQQCGTKRPTFSSQTGASS